MKPVLTSFSISELTLLLSPPIPDDFTIRHCLVKLYFKEGQLHRARAQGPGTSTWPKVLKYN